MKEPQERNQGGLGRVHAEEGLGQSFDAGSYHHRPRRALRRRPEIAGIDEKRYVLWARLVEGATPVTRRSGSPTSVAPSASASRPSVYEAPTAAYFLAFRISSSKALITSSVTSISGAP